MLLPKACFCLLIIFTWSSASGHQRTSVLDWSENSSILQKKIFSSCSKISKYSAPLQRSSVSHQLNAPSSSKFCYILSQPQDFFSMGRQSWPLGYLLNRPDVRWKLDMDLAVAFEHLQHQIEVGCAAQPQTALGPWLCWAWSQHSDSRGPGLSASRRQLPGKAWPGVML